MSATYADQTHDALSTAYGTTVDTVLNDRIAQLYSDGDTIASEATYREIRGIMKARLVASRRDDPGEFCCSPDHDVDTSAPTADRHRALIAAMEPAQWPEARQGFARFTDEQVLEIRQRYHREDTTFDEIAKDYGVTATAITDLVHGDTYKYCEGPLSPAGANHRKGERHPRAKWSDAVVDELRERYAKGDISQQQLADEYGMSRSNVSNIIHNRRRASA